MPKISEDEVIRIHIVVFKKDYDELQKMATKSTPVSKIIRTIVSTFVLHATDEVRRKIDAIEKSDAQAIELEL